MSSPEMNDARAANDPNVYTEFGSMRLLAGTARLCTRCDLAQTHTQVVFGDGNDQSDLVIVGEGPGEDEDAQGRPFVGRSGRLMDSLLKEAGFQRENLWVTNVVKSRPTKIENGRIGNRPPQADEIKACDIWWRNEIRLIKPKVVLALGAIAAKAMGADKKFQITKDRGVWLPGPFNSELFVTFHPAYILRLNEPVLSQVKQTVVDDMKIVQQRLQALRDGTATPHAWQKAQGEGQQLSLF